MILYVKRRIPIASYLAEANPRCTEDVDQRLLEGISQGNSWNLSIHRQSCAVDPKRSKDQGEGWPGRKHCPWRILIFRKAWVEIAELHQMLIRIHCRGLPQRPPYAILIQPIVSGRPTTENLHAALLFSLRHLEPYPWKCS